MLKSRKPLSLALVTLLLIVQLAAGLRAAEQTWTTIETSPEEQLKIFQELAAKTAYSCIETDEAGNITFVCFNHSKFANSDRPEEHEVKNENPDELPGLGNEDFQRIRHFPKLQGVLTQFQPIGNEGYKVLQAFPDLKLAALKNLKNGFEDDEEHLEPTDEVFQYLDGARDLVVWDTTHSFGFSRGEPKVLNTLQGFPELKVMIVDVGHSDDFEELFPLIQKCPKIEWLKLHRCSFTEDQVIQILDALPNLKRFEMKPRGNEPGKHWSYQTLRVIKNYPNLKALRLIHGDALPLPWEDGLEHLVEAKNLKYIDWPGGSDKNPGVSPEDLAKLQEARPDLIILPAIDRKENPEEFQKARQYPDEIANPMPYDWQIGPN